MADTADLSPRRPTAIGGMTPEQLDAELQKGIDSVKSGISYTPDELESMMERKYHIDPYDGHPRPTAVGGMTREQLDAEIAKGIASIQRGDVCTQEEMNAIFAEEFGV